jgi:predicted MFS family arabinose efflux permease
MPSSPSDESIEDLPAPDSRAAADAPGRQPEARLLAILAVCCGLSVANIYFNQPLLLEISRAFHVSEGRAAAVSVATQVSYAAGLLLLVPLGDVRERRRLILLLFLCIAAFLALAALAPALSVLIAASVGIGVSSAITHVIVPIAPELVAHEQRGRAIATVMTGVLLGALLGRALSGAVASLAGWRVVFASAAAVNLLALLLLRRGLPGLPAAHPVPYGQAMRSLFRLLAGQPLLREAAAQSGLVFSSFSGFWTTLPFLLGSPRYHLGPVVVGAFGLVGAAGVTVAPLAGRMSDRRGSRYVIDAALLVMAVSWLVLWAGQRWLVALIAGCILLDAGTQMSQIANQTRVFGLLPQARARINTVYMTLYFLGAAAGSAGATLAWEHGGWTGVSLAGLGLLALSALVHWRGGRKLRVRGG